MQNQSRDYFPTGTKKNPKECMAVTLRSGKELKEHIEGAKDEVVQKEEVRVYQPPASFP